MSTAPAAADPITAIRSTAATLVAIGGPLADGMGDVVAAVERLQAPARQLAAQAAQPLVLELLAAIESIAAPLRETEQKLGRLAGQE